MFNVFSVFHYAFWLNKVADVTPTKFFERVTHNLNNTILLSFAINYAYSTLTAIPPSSLCDICGKS